MAQSLTPSIDDILTGIRVPELPYPVGRPGADGDAHWLPLLRDCWQQRLDTRVCDMLAGSTRTWSLRQVNSAYVADRIMDVFLRTSGLHPVLVQRVARLRYLLAWRLDSGGGEGLDRVICDWLDSLADWRGWSDSGGRSARALLDQLEHLEAVILACFDQATMAPFEGFARAWFTDAAQRQQRSRRLHQRLLETERGAARQRRADMAARALVGRALEQRQLPEAITRFVFDHWLGLLRQIAWQDGPSGDRWRHGSRLLEWLVWVGDPELSQQDRNRLYQVGEQLSDRLGEVWQRVHEEALPAATLHSVEAVIVARLRGEEPMCRPPLRPGGRFDFDLRWLAPETPAPAQVLAHEGNWFAEGEGNAEQRRYFLGVLTETAEVLWSNGYGVRLGTMAWSGFDTAVTAGELRPLPQLNRFGDVMTDTVTALYKVMRSQRQQRQDAAASAQARARQLREAKADAERQRLQEEAEQAEALRQEQAAAAERTRAEAVAVEAHARQLREQEAARQVETIKLGGWIVLAPAPGQDSEQRLKLAVRTNASRKLVFVDRLGLNRTELTVNELVQKLADNQARVLGSSADFDDTLTRVVGRIRVGRH